MREGCRDFDPPPLRRIESRPGATWVELPLSSMILPRHPARWPDPVNRSTDLRARQLSASGSPSAAVGRLVPPGANVAQPSGQQPQGVTSEGARIARFQVLRLRLRIQDLLPPATGSALPANFVLKVLAKYGQYPELSRSDWQGYLRSSPDGGETARRHDHG